MFKSAIRFAVASAFKLRAGCYRIVSSLDYLGYIGAGRL